MFYNRVEYTLKSRLGVMKLDRDPMGWEDASANFMRSNKSYGMFLKLSQGLKFTGEAREFIERNFEIDGFKALVELHRREKNPLTDEWETAQGYPMELDFIRMELEDNKLTITAQEGKLREILASNAKEKFELNRIENISGAPITPLETDALTIRGREIYLLSKFKEASTTFTAKSGDWDSGGELREAFHPLPFSVIANSDPENIQPPQESYSFKNKWKLSSGNMFFHRAERNRGLTKLKIKFSFKISDLDANRAENVNIKLVLDRYLYDESSETHILQERTVLKDLGFPSVGDSFSYESDEIQLEPKKNESFALGLYQVGQYGGPVLPPTYDGWANYTYSDFIGSLSWAEDSFYPRTNAPFLTALEVGTRLTEIFTGKRKFISDLLTSGDWKDLGFTCGGWIRNLKIKTEEGTEREWPLTISFDDFYQSIHAVTPVGYGIVTKGAKQFLAFEHIRYFFQPYVTIKLEEQVSIKRKVAEEFVFSSITTGYTKGGNYEKPLGLDEPNIQATCISPINVTDNKYNVLGASRTDGYAVEDARRMQRENYADEDTPYDKDNFLIDAKFSLRSNLKNYYEVRTWRDDLEVPPTGIYSPETAFNLRLSPANNKMRHSRWFNNALFKHPTEKLRYANTEGNSELSTKFPGKPAIKENADVLISELSNPIFQPEWIEFEYPIEHEVIRQLYGTTEINGKEINNHYGLVEFINDKGLKEKGYLFEARIENNIKFKLLKSDGA